MLQPEQARELAHALWIAEQTRVATQPPRERVPDFTTDDAYAVQQAVTALRVGAGARPVGRKIGLSSRWMLQRAGVTEPFWAFIFESGQRENGAVLDVSGWIRPRLEVEIALVLGADLDQPDTTIEQARAAIAAVHPSFEIVDTRTTTVGLDAIESIADSGSNAGFVLGPRIPAAGIDLSAVTARVVGGSEVGQASTLFDGEPAGGLRWLANHAATHGHPLRAGEIVLSGTLLPVLPLNPGTTVIAEFSGLDAEPLAVQISGR